MKTSEEISDRLLTVDEFRRRFFTRESRPSRADARAWIDAGYLAGVKIGARVYVSENSARELFTRARIIGAPRTDEQDARRYRQSRAASTLREFGFKL